LLYFGFVYRQWFLMSIAIFMGITSHILFIAPALALWATRRLKPDPLTLQERRWIAAICVALLPYLLRVYLKIPDWEKAAALIALDVMILMDCLFPWMGNQIPNRAKTILFRLALCISIPSFLFLLFFSEGHWNVLFNYGWIAHPIWIGWSWALLLGWIGYGFFRSDRDFRNWLILSLLLISLISTKPTARYYETGFLAMALMASLAIERVRLSYAFLFLGGFAMLSSFQLWQNYFEVGLQQLGQERYFSFYIPRDNSSDFLPKQDLARHLGEHGCRFEDILSGDSRILEGLRFLAIGDWPIQSESGSCTYGKFSVNRKTQAFTPAPGTKRLAEVGPFVIDQ
jgi:hypothetical protein